MWVSQTYLTNLRADGAVSAYFLFEAYREDHKQIERAIRPMLGNLALSFGDDAHVYVPAEESRGRIAREFNDWLRRDGLQGIKLPGMLILEYEMNDPRSTAGDAVFISFSDLLDRPETADDLLEKVGAELEAFKDQLQSTPDGVDGLLENFRFAPGLWGLEYDLTPQVVKLVKGVSRTWRSVIVGRDGDHIER